MELSYATIDDVAELSEKDHHLSLELLTNKVIDHQVLIIKDEDKIVAWLRYGFFWDDVPFINLLFVEETYRRLRLGTEMVLFWERKMANSGYKQAMTSALASEDGQFFWRNLGYIDCGSLLFNGESTELFFSKKLLITETVFKPKEPLLD